MRILKTDAIEKTRFLNLNVTHYRDTKGKDAEWYWAERPGAQNAVVIVALTEDDKLVVTEEFRVPIGGYEWGLPAGLIDGNESPERTARRELKEETGLNVTRILSVSPLVYNSPGLTNEGVHMVSCTAGGELNTEGNEMSEDIEVHLMSPQDVDQLMKREDVMIGAKAWMVFQRFMEHGDI